VTAAGFAAAAAVGSVAALAAGLLLRRFLARMRRLRWQVLAVTLASLAAGAAVASVLAEQMVLDAEELRTVIAVLGATGAFAAILVVTATSTLGRDVRRLEATVRAIEAGDRAVRAQVARADELGHVASALDDAVARLGLLERQRAADDENRAAMFASISHDLRTPLSALRAAIEALEDGVTPDPVRYLRSMARDVEALTALVDDLVLLSRIEAGDLDMPRTHIDLGELADEAAEALAPVAEARGVELHVDAPDGAALAVGNPTALGRIIRNLVDNAIRHSPGGSVVHITVTAAAGDRPTVRVRDHGAGFPPSFVDRAFERFSRADESRSRSTGGSGLGLAIARGLIDAQGGDIWIDEGDGAAVTFALPAPAR
jgi:signal transduction histidine kinase